MKPDDVIVVEADIHHPTDTGLLSDGVKVITRVVTKLKKLVPGIGNGVVNHERKVKKMYLGLMKFMKRKSGKDDSTLKKTRDRLVKITEKVIIDGQVVQAEVGLLQEKSSMVKGLTQ